VSEQERTAAVHASVDEKAAELAGMDHIRAAVHSLEVPISQVVLRFEEKLRELIPVTAGEAPKTPDGE
jgi:hypothetical protein